MRNSDLIVRIAAFLTLFSSMWNGFMCMIWVVMLIWVLVGVLWLVPLILAMIQFGLAILFLVTGHNKAVAVAPVIGLFVSVCTFNFFGGMLEMINLCLMIASYVMRANEDQAAMAA